ncbi:MAG: type II toxin-antitoxin system VapC family toxin [Isosphaeraceae bacterium]
MIVLDTQPVSQLQRVGSKDVDRIEERLQGIPVDQVRITVITPIEQLREALGKINSANDATKQVAAFQLFLRLLDHYSRRWSGRILPFDERAVTEFRKFRPELIRRIGRCDAQIAAIALAHGATLMTSNKRDFQQVPGLYVEDWLR